jgi:hypothetical protein
LAIEIAFMARPGAISGSLHCSDFEPSSKYQTSPPTDGFGELDEE